jgi:uncharacterized sulfatase
MRTLYKEGKLNENQKSFFESLKPKEELYNLKDDPHQLNNLANNPEFKSVLDRLRIKTQEYDEEMTPVSSVYEPIITDGPEIVEWLKKELPEEYARMVAGEEIGYKRIGNAYKAAHKKLKKNK